MTSTLWVPWAVKKEVHFSAQMPDLVHGQSSTLAMHTNGGHTERDMTKFASLFHWFDRPGNNICSHFQTMFDGTLEQYLPLNKQAYAQFAANPFAWSNEHEDDGDNTKPLSAAQLATDNRLIDYLGVPRVIAPEIGGGVGWHNLYPSWNQSGHDCVGAVREAQYRNLLAQGADEMTDADLLKIAKITKANQDVIITHIREPLLAKIAALQADVDALKAKPAGYGA